MQQSVRFTSHQTRLPLARTKPAFLAHRSAPVARLNMAGKADGAAMSTEMQSAITAVKLASKLCKVGVVGDGDHPGMSGWVTS
jgi:hypothetical protein